MDKKIIIIGGGGHSRVLVDILRLNSVEIFGFVDLKPKKIKGLKNLGTDEKIKEFKPEDVLLVNGVASVKRPEQRQKVFEDFKKLGYEFTSVIHPKAIISPQTELGEGVQVIAGAVINNETKIGDNVIINTSASVDHDCEIGAHTHIAPGVTLSGDVKIGQGCHIGTGANIIQGITIGNNVLVAAGQTVRQNYSEGATVYTQGAYDEQTIR